MSVSVHVIDNSRGAPAAKLTVRLVQHTDDGPREQAGRTTGPDGRAADLADGPLLPGTHCLVFETGAYYRGLGLRSFHPRVLVEFTVDDPDAHVHIPLLITPFAYTTYRGN